MKKGNRAAIDRMRLLPEGMPKKGMIHMLALGARPHHRANFEYCPEKGMGSDFCTVRHF